MTNKQRDHHLGRGTWALMGALAAGLCAWSAIGWQSLDARAAVAPGHSRQPSEPLVRLSEDLPSWQEPDVPLLSEHPEAQLLAAYRLVGQGQLGSALVVAQRLTQTHPEFRLGQLLYADLLMAHHQPLPDFGAAVSADGNHAATTLSPDVLAGLRAEAQARLAALADKPKANTLPAEFITLPASVPYALAVDTSRSRMFLFQQVNDGRWTLKEDFYVSVGKRGVGKQSEGDQRTPLGVYYTLGHVPEGKLDERFGAGALPLNYPNALDKQQGKTGSGILLHGVPATTYSRPPLDSDGCVAMANDDLRRLSSLLPPRDTPVVITRELHWVTPDKRPGAPADFESSWNRWQAIRQGQQTAAIDAFYQPDALANVDDDARGTAKRFRDRLAEPAAAIDNVSMLTWKDQQPTMVVTFREHMTQGKRRDQGVRQYWARGKDGWQIVAEGPVRL